MTTCYKLTRQDNTTYNNCLWGEGITHETDGIGELCGPGWLHAYSHPLLAVFLNPIHADIENPKLWECIGDGRCLDDRGLKCGYTRLTTVREVPLPEVTTEQRIAFTILCSKEVCRDPKWTVWADNWLSGDDRTETAALAATSTADYWAARAAARAVARAAYLAEAAYAAAYAAARAADWAADVAANLAVDIDLVSLAKKAMEY